MSSAELKLKLFRQIDNLDKSKVEELYGLFLNFINGKKNLTDWNNLREEEREGILNAVKQIDENTGIPHSKVISRAKKKYANS